MWRRTYLFFVLLRLYFALSSSYLHPDENFQGPEVIAGRVFSYPVHETWEFTSDNPIRSAFPLWPVYGLPMLILRWLWEGIGKPEVAPSVVFWTLRTLMFVLSFVLEDWALHELFDSPQRRRVAIMLVASSYVTWTWQMHTFSNSIETLVLVWTLVLVKRVVETPRQRSPLLAPAVLAVLLVFGVFNRVTFVAYAFAPLLELLPHFWVEPSSLVVMLFFGILTTIAAITIDTSFYTEGRTTFTRLIHHPVITPWNNLRYNTQASNLAIHGSHPFYQHLLINLPQLLGPAYLLFLTTSWWKSMTFRTAICGIAILSFIPHQEARFLLPAIPLILASVRIPSQYPKQFIGIWLAFNAVLGVLMGIYHQGGIVPVQTWLSGQTDISQVFWWKTYSPPIWLLNGRNENLTTIDLMGLNKDLLQSRICEKSISASDSAIVLVAPRSADFLDRFSASYQGGKLDDAPQVHLEELWSYRNHLNLDDLDFGDDGVWPTLSRVVGRRGLVAWKVICDSPSHLSGRFIKDW